MSTRLGCEEAQLIQVGDVLGDGLEAGQEKVADGKVGADAIGQKVVDFGSELPRCGCL
jgi:hypothetical protein